MKKISVSMMTLICILIFVFSALAANINKVNISSKIANGNERILVPFGATCGANAGHSLFRIDTYVHQRKNSTTCIIMFLAEYRCRACDYAYAYTISEQEISTSMCGHH